MGGEGVEGRGGGDLEEGDGRAGVDPLHLVQHVRQLCIADQGSGKADALGEAKQRMSLETITSFGTLPFSIEVLECRHL